MAAKRSVEVPVDYQQLHSFSSVVLYDTIKRKRGKFYEAERIIERRWKGKAYEYLIKWKDWPLESSSWEPTENLNHQLLRSYTYPAAPSNNILQEASRQFLLGVFTSLKSSLIFPVYVNMRLDVWRYIIHNKGTPSAYRGHLMLGKEDLHRLKFPPDNWWYIINEHGEGSTIDFSLKTKPVLSWSPISFIEKEGRLFKAPRLPNERVCISLLKKPYNISSNLK